MSSLRGVDRDGQSLDPWGVVIHRASYRTVTAFTALIERAGTLGVSSSQSLKGSVKFTAPGQVSEYTILIPS